MAIREENSVVGIEYEVKEAGTDVVLDDNKGGEALEFITGKGHVIPGLEAQLAGMSEGDSADILVKSDDAYGASNPEAVQTLPKEHFEGVELEAGMMLYGQSEDGGQMQVMVQSFTDTDVTIDGNHPLAGKDLMFSVVVLSERDATEEEIEHGQVGGASSCSTDGGDSCGCSH